MLIACKTEGITPFIPAVASFSACALFTVNHLSTTQGIVCSSIVSIVSYVATQRAQESQRWKHWRGWYQPRLEQNGGAESKPPRFVTFVRLSFVFKQNRRAWMAFLMLRRASIVAAVMVGTTSVLGPPGQILILGNTFDYRVVPFLLLCYFVVSHAEFSPYAIHEDNTLETCSLIALLMSIYADVSMQLEAGVDGTQADDGCDPTKAHLDNGTLSTAPSAAVCDCDEWNFTLARWVCQLQYVKANTLIVTLSVIVVAYIWIRQRKNRSSRGVMAKTGLTGRLTREHSRESMGSRSSSFGSARSGSDLDVVLTLNAANEFSVPTTRSSSSDPGEGQVSTHALNESIGLSLPEVAMWKEAFEKFDQDSNGKLDLDELFQTLQQLDGQTQREEVKRLFDMDDDNEQIDLPGFLKVMKKKRDNVNAQEELTMGECAVASLFHPVYLPT